MQATPFSVSTAKRKKTESRSNIYHERNKQFEQEASFKYKIFRFALRSSGFKTGRGTLIQVPASWHDGDSSKTCLFMLLNLHRNAPLSSFQGLNIVLESVPQTGNETFQKKKKKKRLTQGCSALPRNYDNNAIRNSEVNQKHCYLEKGIDKQGKDLHTNTSQKRQSEMVDEAK
ncbi:hypothetical protein HNY73_010738 [Argiope bruennichi]|nr:hypothetical protein HNY73_010738 [Argiope bruennichi]